MPPRNNQDGYAADYMRNSTKRAWENTRKSSRSFINEHAVTRLFLNEYSFAAIEFNFKLLIV